MIITLRHLYYMSLVGRIGSFRAAAEAAGVSQPVISNQIASIETHYGVRLFERHQSGARPTVLGWNYIHSADRILAEFSRMEERVRAGATGTSGTLSVGFYKSVSRGILRACFKAIVQSFPQIRLDPVVASFSDLAHAVRSGSIDLAVLATETNACEDLQIMPLWSDRIMVVLPETHPFAERDHVYWTELLDERFLLSRHDPGPDLANLLTANLASPGKHPNIVLMQINREDVLSLVGIGAGISLQCESANGLAGLGVVFREVRDATKATRIAYSAFWRSENGNPALSIFLDLLRNSGRIESIDAR